MEHLSEGSFIMEKRNQTVLIQPEKSGNLNVIDMYRKPFLNERSY